MNDLEILSALKTIKEESGNNAKEALLKQFDNDNFKKALKYLYDTQIVFGLSDKKLSKKVNNVELAKDFINILDAFSYLEQHNTGTDFDVFAVQHFIEKFDESHKEMLKEMFAKKLKIGITEGTLAKVYPDMFVKFDVMKGESYFDKVDKIEKDKPNIILTQKLDGIRCLARVENNKVILYARSGKIISGLKDLENELKELPNGMYDGELLKIIDGTLVDISKYPEKAICHKLYFPKNAEELYSETVSIVNSKEENKKDVGLFLFDMTSLEAFDKKIKFDEPTTIRKQKLEMLLSTYKFNFVKFVPTIYEGSFDEVIVKKYLDEVVVLEQEGLMLNYANAPYEFKRTNNLIKVKQVYSADVKIRGFEEGTGKYKNMLGAFIIKTPQGIEVKVGSGLTDKFRKDVWKNQKDYIGSIIEIAFTTPSTSKDSNNYNLRFPRFIGLRNDKIEENWEQFDKLIEELEREKK